MSSQRRKRRNVVHNSTSGVAPPELGAADIERAYHEGYRQALRDQMHNGVEALLAVLPRLARAL